MTWQIEITMKRWQEGTVVSLIYVLCIAGGWKAYDVMDYVSCCEIASYAWGYLAATLICFVFSMLLDNSSMYDPFWSVFPMVMSIYWWYDNEMRMHPRSLAILLLVVWWGWRLTYNWWRGWKGLDHEDWRYVDFRAAGMFYWPLSLVGIHGFPSFQTFAGSVPMFLQLANPHTALPWNVYDFLALGLGIIAILLETVADRQLLAFRQSSPSTPSICKQGLWSVSRHPNYLGEVLFWWAMTLFGWASGNWETWAIIGPIAIHIMFLVISIPLIERRMVKHRGKAYEEWKKNCPVLFPWKMLLWKKKQL